MTTSLDGLLHRRSGNPLKRRAAKRQKATARTRRYRQRRQDGVAVYRVEISATVIDMLVRLGWLRDGEATDSREVSRAIAALLADAAKG
jgi:hypothetical protein